MLILGVDYGRSRTGVAIGDTETGLTFPLKVIEEREMAVLADQLLRLAADEDCQAIVLGRPVRLTGGSRQGEIEQVVMALAKQLAADGRFAVETEDERLSTAYAEKMKRAAGSASKIAADAIAAAAILETYLERTGT
jgi:putative Holliday junction resolvase